jgi:zinc protease
MRLTVKRLAVALLILGAAHAVSAQTADAIVEKSLTALGGRAALQKLKSRSTAGTITLSTPAGDIEGSIEILNATPNKVRTLINVDLSSLGAGQLVIDQRFDGTVGYAMDSLQGNRDVTGNQLDNMRNGSFPHPFLNYKELGFAAKLGGKEKVGDREAYVLTLEPPTGSAVRHYIDADSYLPIRLVVTVDVPQLGSQVEQTTDFLDYREVDGVKLPFKVNVSSSIQRFAVVVTKLENNVPIDPTLFSKPAAR